MSMNEKIGHDVMGIKNLAIDGKTRLPMSSRRLRASMLALSLLSSGCVYESQGLPVIEAGRMDARSDLSGAERVLDGKSADAKTGEPRPMSDLRLDVRKPDASSKDYTPYDLSKPDTIKPDAKTGCALAFTGSFSGTINSGTPEYVGGYRFDYMGKSGTDAIFDISCNGSIVAYGKKCPLGANTVITVISDKITIHPHAVSASLSNVSIQVEVL